MHFHHKILLNYIDFTSGKYEITVTGRGVKKIGIDLLSKEIETKLIQEGGNHINEMKYSVDIDSDIKGNKLKLCNDSNETIEINSIVITKLKE